MAYTSIGPHVEAVEVVDSRAHFLCEWKHNAQACIRMYVQYAIYMSANSINTV